MKNLEFYLDLDKHWDYIYKKWNLNSNVNYFDNNTILNTEMKNKFNINFLLIIKKIFNKEDINEIKKIKITSKNINEILNNFKKNFKLGDFIYNNDYLSFLLNIYNDHKIKLNLLKEKIIKILVILFNDENIGHLYINDDDFTRLIAPLGGSFLYLLYIKKDLNKTLDNFLNLDNIVIIFYNISYLIIDNIMDTDNTSKENKKIFLDWFMNGLDNIDNFSKINNIQEKIWQINTFSKYFKLFEKKFNHKKYPDLYKYVKFMFNVLYTSNKIQKSDKIDEKKILECTFKKSYWAIFFLGLILNYKFNIYMHDDYFDKFIYVSLLIQLIDDYFDIKKDINEKNNTLFTSGNINENVNKLISNNFYFLNELDISNPILKNMLSYMMFEVTNILLFNNRESINKEFIENYSKNSIFYKNSFEIFNDDIYDIFNQNLFVILIKNKFKIN